MGPLLNEASTAIYAYSYGMDINNWKYATSYFANKIAVDYSQVGMLKAEMSNQDLQEFLRNLLGKPGLKVHTAVSQVFENPQTPSEFIAYYSVKHFKGELGKSEIFFVYGWYTFRMENSKVSSLTINVQAMEGDPAVIM